MTFRNDRQRGQVAQTLTDRLGKGPFFRSDEYGTPRPTSTLSTHLKRCFASYEAILVRLAWDVWTGDGHCRLDLALTALDGTNLTMVGGLLVAIGASGDMGGEIDRWIVRWSGQ
jgi:hypothetical protein